MAFRVPWPARIVLLIGGLCLAIPFFMLDELRLPSAEAPGPPTDEELYLSADEALREAVETEGAEAALGMLRTRIAENIRLASLCHPLAHTVGRAAYVRYGFSGAIAFRDDVCGTGYLHGIVESHFIGLPDPETAARTLCGPQAADCFHGVGHGLMLAFLNDVGRSIDVCRTLDRGFQRIQCAEGVYMELFQIEDESHVAADFGPGGSMTPCGEVEDPYRATCAFYAPRHYLRVHPEKDWAGALAMCEAAGRPTQDACVKGLGSAAMKGSIDSPLAVERFCLTLPEPDRTYCAEGMTSYWIVHFASSRAGRELCAMTGEELRGACRRIADESVRFYPD